jgi:hypothetical protein
VNGVVVRPGVAWSWSRAALGLAYGAPAAAVTAMDTSLGLTLSVGVLCAANVPLSPSRRRRTVVLVAGGLAGLGIFIGSCAGLHPALAIPFMFLAAVTVAVAAPRFRLGRLVLSLTLPLAAAGLSLDGPRAGAEAGLLILSGSAYAWVISVCWPDTSSELAAVAAPSPSPGMDRGYPLRLGIAAATTSAIGYALGLDHPGWPCTSAMLVSRVDRDLTRQRMQGRAVAVTLGACAAAALAAARPPAAVTALCVCAVLAAMTATVGSRWYIAGGFSSFVVVSLLATTQPDATWWWFVERVLATLLGVAVAAAALLVGTQHRSGLKDEPGR